MFQAKFNAAGSRLELLLYGQIGEDFFGEGITGQAVAAAIRDQPRAKSIDVRINSEGGNALEGFNIFNLLRRQSAEVNTFVDGAALSAASVVMMAGRRVEAAENSMIMIHDASSGLFGNADELRARADILDTVSEKIAETYAGRSMIHDAGEFRALMRAETWLSATEAMDAGLVDTVGTPLDIAAHFDAKRFSHPPSWALERASVAPADHRARLAAARARLA